MTMFSGINSGSGRPDVVEGVGVVRRPTLGIIGAGRVGGALARQLFARGYVIGAIYSRSGESRIRLAAQVGALAVDSPAAVAEFAQLMVLSVPDAAIQAVCEALSTVDLTDKAVLHTSGATPLTALHSARLRRALVGGLHPISPIVNDIPGGVTFGLEADREPLRGWLMGIVLALDGLPLWLRAGTDRARYHASAVIVSNYLVTLFAEGLALLSRYTLDEGAARVALLGLARTALDNIEAQGTAAALTGPIARGDAETVAAHLASLEKLDPELGQLYRLLGQRTLRLASARGLDSAQMDHLKSVLEDQPQSSNSPSLLVDKRR